jgi:pilus assembly protein Flp/PilA
VLSKISEFTVALLGYFRSEKGQALAEYGLILALIAVVAIVAVTAVGVAVSGTFDRLTQCLI